MYRENEERSRREAEKSNDADVGDLRMFGRRDHSQHYGPKASKIRPSQATGPKGVKKDYEEAKMNMQIHRVFEAMRLGRQIKEGTLGSKKYHLESEVGGGGGRGGGGRGGGDSGEELNQRSDIGAAAASATEAATEMLRMQSEEDSKKNQVKAERGLQGDSDDDDDLFGDDDALLEKIRAQRISEIQAALPTYGVYTRMHTLKEMSECIHSTHELTKTVVHVYENRILPCLALHLTFEHIAPQFPHVQFIRVRADEAMKGYKDAGLPTLLIYTGSQLTESLIGLAPVLGLQPSDMKVVQYLADKGVLKVPTGGITQMSKERLLSEWHGDDDLDQDNQRQERVESVLVTGVYGSTIKRSTGKKKGVRIGGAAGAAIRNKGRGESDEVGFGALDNDNDDDDNDDDHENDDYDDSARSKGEDEEG